MAPLGRAAGWATAAAGTYVLLLRLRRAGRLEVGRLGELALPAGWYLYVGSALGGLGPRLRRHLRRGKPAHWHVDHLREAAELVAIAYRPGPERLECAVAAALRARPGAGLPAARFGASDCRCPAHLIHFARRPEARPGPGWRLSPVARPAR